MEDDSFSFREHIVPGSNSTSLARVFFNMKLFLFVCFFYFVLFFALFCFYNDYFPIGRQEKNILGLLLGGTAHRWRG